MHARDLYRSLRLLLEVDRDLGIHFVARSEAPATGPQADQANAAASPPAPPPPRPELVLPDGDAATRLGAIAAHVADCKRCGLCASRRNTVPGEGDPQADLLFIGEAPGQDEDLQGRPFVGAAGQLLDRMILAMGLQRQQVFIANVLKCRPPGNRRPEETEVEACRAYLDAQIDSIAPRIICTLGNTPLRALKPGAAGITRERGRRFSYRDIPVVPTFHPSYLLRNEAAKKPCWSDLQQVMAALGLPAS